MTEETMVDLKATVCKHLSRRRLKLLITYLQKMKKKISLAVLKDIVTTRPALSEQLRCLTLVITQLLS